MYIIFSRACNTARLRFCWRILNRNNYKGSEGPSECLSVFSHAAVSSTTGKVENLLVSEQCGLAIHLLHGDLSMADQDVASSKQASGNLGLSVHDVSKLDLLFPKFLLVLLQPSLIVLNKKMNGVTFRKESRTKSGVLDIAWNGADHELLPGAPPRVRGGAAGLKPILPLAVFVGHRYQRVVLHLVQTGLAGPR